MSIFDTQKRVLCKQCRRQFVPEGARPCRECRDRQLTENGSRHKQIVRAETMGQDPAGHIYYRKPMPKVTAERMVNDDK